MASTIRYPLLRECERDGDMLAKNWLFSLTRHLAYSATYSIASVYRLGGEK